MPLSDEVLTAAGVTSEELNAPNYVKAAAVLEDMEMFDGEFFGFNAKEAAILDPQHRHFLECGWEALEHAGYDPYSYEGAIGCFAGCGMQAYFAQNLLPNRRLVENTGYFLLRHTGNDKDFLSTRLSYALNLRGPSMSVQTACSTSLVAVHLAAQSLLSGECDTALAGGVTIEVPHRHGYLYEEGEILSRDGHCRSFDAGSTGTVFGSGAGVVVLRRLEDALADGNTIHAVLLGSAINNDGAGKVSYLAPSVAGQSAAIAEALAVAGVDASSITFVETHGTGTKIGDPIEITALTRAFRNTATGNGFCALGAVKSNIGHLDTAAGVAGFIKAVLSVKNGKIPPTLHYQKPNLQIDFPSTPFFVNAALRDWSLPSGVDRRRAGVNSLGVGGTNAFVIVEEPPATAKTVSEPGQLLVWSARNAGALDRMTQRFAQYLAENRTANLADAAYTLQKGRHAFAHRRVLAVRDIEDAIQALEARDPKRVFTTVVRDKEPSLAFMFPGGGAQYPRMGQELYEREALYRQIIDDGFSILKKRWDIDIRPLMFPEAGGEVAAAAELERPLNSILSIFLTEYALARLWMEKGLKPTVLTGHSLGEYTAACLSGVMSMTDALTIVVARGRIFEKLPAGAMLSVPLPEEEVRQHMEDGQAMAAVNAPGLCVVSGSEQAIEALQARLLKAEIESQRLKISVAAHSGMLDPFLDEFRSAFGGIQFKAPAIPFISNLTGTLVDPDQVRTPDYWVQHLRQTVRFSAGMQALNATSPNCVLLEVGPGNALCALARQHPVEQRQTIAIPSMRHPRETGSDRQYLLSAYGQMWAAGCNISWDWLHEGKQRNRVPLPTYPFEKNKHWVAPEKTEIVSSASSEVLRKRPNVDDWFSRPLWAQTAPAVQEAHSVSHWLIFDDEVGLATGIAAGLRGEHSVTHVKKGAQFSHLGPNLYSVNPEDPSDFEDLLAALGDEFPPNAHIVYLWTVDLPASESNSHRELRPRAIDAFAKAFPVCFSGLFNLARALSQTEPSSRLTVISSALHSIGSEVSNPLKALLLGPVMVLPREFPNIQTRSIDVQIPNSAKIGDVARQILRELSSKQEERLVAYRWGERWTRQIVPCRLNPTGDRHDWLRQRGAYVISGGLGGIGLVIAKHLASLGAGYLLLISRRQLPNRAGWAVWLNDNPSSDPVSSQIRQIQEIESLGARVLPVAADVTDVQALAGALNEARNECGAIHGVIHAAGVLDDGLIPLKSAESVRSVINAKALGALALDEVFVEDDLDFFVLFSSVSAFLGIPGQVDYTAANAFLDAFAQERSHRCSGRTVAINWNAWRDVGMTARALSATAGAAQSKGVKHPVSYPCFESCLEMPDGSRVFSGPFQPETSWLLSEHRTKEGWALVPGTGFVELIRAAVALDVSRREGGLDGAIELENVQFLFPFHVPDGKSVTLNLSIESPGAARRVSVYSESPEVPHCTGQAKIISAPVFEHYDIAAVQKACTQPMPAPGGFMDQQFMNFGPRWACIRSIHRSETEALVHLQLPPEFAADLQAYKLHPALLDMSTGACQLLIAGFSKDNDFYVPMSYGRVVILGAMPAEYFSHVRFRPGNSREVASFDITLVGTDGVVFATVESFTMKRIAAGTSGFAATPGSKSADSVHSDAARASESNAQLEAVLKEAILPPEGVHAFDKLMGEASCPQWIVSSVDPALWQRQLDEAGKPTTASEDEAFADMGAGAELSADFAAPENEIEQAIARIWSNLLGVGTIPRNEEFFNLGGHSLLGLRVISQVNRTFDLHLAPPTLFEHPTVEKLAKLVVDENPGLAEQFKKKARSIPKPKPAKPDPAKEPASLPADATPETSDPSRPEQTPNPVQATPQPSTSSIMKPQTQETAQSPKPQVRGVDLDRLLAVAKNIAHPDAEMDLIRIPKPTGTNSYSMLESGFAKSILAPMFASNRRSLRAVLKWLILKLEGGELYTVTLRKLYKKHYDFHVGDYSGSCFDVGYLKPRTRIGRYCSIFPTARIETANHPTSVISSHGVFYHKAMGYSEGIEIPRNRVSIGHDVHIGHNATILYPCQTIGTGAVIGAGALVTFDVPPYAIVGGYPATIIRYRFSKKNIEKLLASRWWNASLEELRDIRGEFMLPLEGTVLR